MVKHFFQLPLKPVPQPRARITRWGNYNPKSKEKALWEWEISQKWPYLPCKGEIHLSLVFTLTPPLSLSVRKKRGLLDEPHIKKPDLSNFIKWMEDCMSGIVFRDDAQITNIQAVKRYGEIAGVTCLLESTDEFRNKREK